MTVLNTAVVVASKLKKFSDLTTEGSLVELTRDVRVEPLVLVDSTIRDLEFMPRVMNTVLNLFTGFYLQGVSVQTQIGNIAVRRHLDQLNPNRDPGAFNVSFESMPVASDYRHRLPNVKTALETHNNSEAVAKDVNLAVGKIIDVTLEIEGKQVKLPILIRLATAPINPRVFVAAMSLGSRKNTLTERWHRMRAGELTLIGDLLLCNDLIDMHKANLKNDTTGFYAEMVRRRRNNKIAALRTEKPSLAAASNIAVIGDATLAQLERELGGKISNQQTRNGLFLESSMMILAVVNAERETITFYYRGIPTPTVLTLRELSSSAKGTGDDIMLIMRALLDNKSPAL